MNRFTPVVAGRVLMDSIETSAELLGAAWFYLALLLVVTVYFRFGRVWSVRNLDLLILMAVGSAIVLVRFKALGFNVGISWMAFAGLALLARILADRYFERRPRIETNLNHPALLFLGLTSIAVLVAAISLSTPDDPAAVAAEQSREILRGDVPDITKTKTGAKKKEDAEEPALSGPATPLALASTMRIAEQTDESEDDEQLAHIAIGILAGLAHLAVVAALLFIGARQFQDWKLGCSAAVLYMLIPSTVLDPNSVTQVLAAALILWALALHRHAWAAGIFMGLACAALLFPAFLLPIWFVYYGRKKWLQFTIALVGVGALMLGGLALLSTDIQAYIQQSLQLIAEGAGFLIQGKSPLTWRITDELYRIPILVTFVILLTWLTFWPRTKKFEHLLTQSAAIVVAAQFWYPQRAGECLTSYVPLFILIAFRPKLQVSKPPRQNGYRRHDAARPMPEREPMLVGNGSGDAFLR